MKPKNCWRDSVKYPDHVDWRTTRQLDALEALVDIEVTGDNMWDIGNWLRKAIELGLLTSPEVNSIRCDLARNI